jgi:putative DNA primase/helicase
MHSRSINLSRLKADLPRDVQIAAAFLLWKREDGRKVPYYVNGKRRRGQNGSAEDRRWLVPFAHAESAYRSGDYDGIGLALLPGLDVIALDFDDCRALNGKISSSLADYFIEQSYAEVSPSGTGIRVLLRGQLPNSKSKGFEVFATTGYVTLTGDRVNNLGVKALTENMRKRLRAVKVRVKHANEPLDRRRILAGVEEGERDDMLFRLACSYRARGLDPREAENLVLLAAREARPPFPLHLARKKVSRAFATYPPPGQDRETNTDAGNSRRLIKAYGADLRWTPGMGWLAWSGTCWRQDVSGTNVMQVAKDTAKSMLREASELPNGDERAALAKWATVSHAANRLKAMVELARSEPEIQVTVDSLDAKPLLLCATNGVVDIETGTLRPSMREDHLTKQAAVECQPGAKAPIWDQFLRRIFDNDKELIAFVQRAVGYTLTGQTGEKCLFFLYGAAGDNGKSTFIETILALMGEYGTKVRADILMRSLSPQKGATPDVVALRGARLVVASELSDRQRFDEAFLKDLTGGVDTVVGRELYRGPIQFRPTAKVWLYGNHRPEMRSDDDAAWRRLYLIPFEVQIPRHEQDRSLPVKLRCELPGILNWALKGYAEYRRAGLQPPECVLAAVNDYRREQDASAEFFCECCTKDRDCREPFAAVHDAYRQWSNASGLNWVSKQKFAALLSANGFPIVRAHSNRRWVKGLRLTNKRRITVRR